LDSLQSAVRSPLVDRFGQRGFLVFYVVIASIVFTALVAVYASVRYAGPPGLALAADPLARGPLIVAIVVGISLMAGALAPRGYWDSPAAVLAEGVRAPFGLERVTRHPFFSGTVLAMGSHALLATHLTGTVFCVGFVVLAIAGSLHQDAKLRALRGQAYDRYLAQTSAIPFIAIATGRQRFVASEMPWGTLAIGLVVAAAIRLLHDQLFDAYGAPFALAVVGGSALIGLITVRVRASHRTGVNIHGRLSDADN
jgi:uncharacterized membrane protein